jgi:hypothetical protein
MQFSLTAKLHTKAYVCTQHLLSPLQPVAPRSNVKYITSSHLILYNIKSSLSSFTYPLLGVDRNLMQYNVYGDFCSLGLVGGQAHMVYCIKQSIRYLLPWSIIAENYSVQNLKC